MLPLGFFLGGLNRPEQFYNLSSIQTTVSLSILSTAALLVITFGSNHQLNQDSDLLEKESGGAAILMLLSYAAYLWFGLRSHYEIFTQPSLKVPKRRIVGSEKHDIEAAFASMGRITATIVTGPKIAEGACLNLEQDEPDDEPQMDLGSIILVLVVFTALLALCTQLTTDNLQGLVDQTAATKTFVAFILLPLLTVDPSTVWAAMEDKQDVNINSNLGANIQTTLGILPAMVVLGLILKIEFTFVIVTLPLVEVIVSNILVLYIASLGKSTW